ncbi:MAG: Mth938-like domain-containing protein [Sulfuricaulis sp.]
MKIHLETGAGQFFIRAYAPGRVTINDEVYTHSLIVTPEQIIRDWPPNSPAELQAVHFEFIVSLRPEVFVLGTGARLQFPAARIIRPLVEAGIGIEVMDTGAACRTYNILMSDGRRVAAALMMIEG